MRLWISIFAVALFAGGTCLGVALHPTLMPERPGTAAPAASPPWSGYGSGRGTRELSVTRFAQDLDLSGEQDRDLDQILGEIQEETQALHRALRAAHDRGRDRITALLSEEQRRRLDELIAAERKKRAEQELEKTLAGYRKLLDLSPEQGEALARILSDGRKSRSGHSRSAADWEAARAFQRKAREEQHQAVKKVLKADQYVRYLEIVEFER
jgi:hypothetical protein